MTKEEYKLKAEEKLAAYKIGAKDKMDLEITNIYGMGNEYVIYETNNSNLIDSVKIYIETLTEEDDSGIIKRFNEIRPKFLEARQNIYKSTNIEETKSSIAKSLSYGLLHSTDEANRQFNELIFGLKLDYRNRKYLNKFRALTIPFIVMLLLSGISICLMIFNFFQKYEHLKDLTYIVTGGAIGGFLSVAIGLKKDVVHERDAPILYLINGAERIFISILASVVIYLCIKSNLVLGICNDIEKPIFGYIVFSIIAGFSETFVPNVLQKLEAENKPK